ncbi:solute carrier family 22 member 18-like [Protopterus annectens]|uniref:solute carrier family 22 member 18-like n=1 Tax=Protopterus annectens TaxID=7888 RepID=UPI001CF9EC5C|nr:solute carrier family 22 member 18-like [Protopterus annectens]
MSKASNVFNLGEITRLLKVPCVMKIFIIKTVAGLPTGLFMVMFSVICMNFFGLKAEHTGYLMSYFGVTQMIIQGLVIGRLTQSYSDETLLRLSVAMISVVGLAKVLMTSITHFCIIVLPLMLSFSLLAVISDSMLTKSVPASDTGAMLGLCSSVHSLTRTVGPTIGGFLYHNYGVPSFGCLQFGVNFILFLYLLKNKLNHRENKQPH